MNRKADANMWWIIIGAVIALIVMIVLMTIFTGGTTKVGKGLLDCEGQGGSCDFSTVQLCKDAEGTPSKSFECPGKPEDYPCCFGTTKKPATE